MIYNWGGWRGGGGVGWEILDVFAKNVFIQFEISTKFQHLKKIPTPSRGAEKGEHFSRYCFEIQNIWTTYDIINPNAIKYLQADSLRAVTDTSAKGV